MAARAATVHLDNTSQDCCLFPALHRAGTNYQVPLHSTPYYSAQRGVTRGRQSLGTGFGPLKGSWEWRQDIIDFFPLPRSAHMSSSFQGGSHYPIPSLVARCLLGLLGGPGSLIL